MYLRMVKCSIGRPKNSYLVQLQMNGCYISNITTLLSVLFKCSLVLNYNIITLQLIH